MHQKVHRLASGKFQKFVVKNKTLKLAIIMQTDGIINISRDFVLQKTNVIRITGFLKVPI